MGGTRARWDRRTCWPINVRHLCVTLGLVLALTGTALAATALAPTALAATAPLPSRTFKWTGTPGATAYRLYIRSGWVYVTWIKWAESATPSFVVTPLRGRWFVQPRDVMPNGTEVYRDDLGWWTYRPM